MKLLRILLPLLLLVSAIAQAQSLSQSQIRQLKNMSASERQRMAATLGIDISSMQTQLGQQGQQGQQKESIQTQYPPGTQFDMYGNPITPPEEDEEMMKMEELEEEDEELKLFGVEIFESSPSTFSPLSKTPVPLNYIIGPGDSLTLLLYGNQNEEYELMVDLEGRVMVPNLGPISVAGMTFSEAKSYITSQIQTQVIGVNVSVTMGELRTIRVFVMGEVTKPGAYMVGSLSTITHALYVSGGVTEIASLRNITHKRGGKTVSQFDLYDLLLNGDSSDDSVLQDGDVVLVPAVEQTVEIDGMVRRPAIYELKGEQTIRDTLALAGGALPQAYTDAIGVERVNRGKRIQLTVDINDKTWRIQSGDRIDVQEVAPEVDDAITLIGAVARPGHYQWYDGITLRDLIGAYEKTLLNTADKQYVLVLREINELGDIEVHQVDLTVAGEVDFPLASRDSVVVFSKDERTAFGEYKLKQLAYSSERLDEEEQKAWEKLIQDKLFWQSVGLEDIEITEQYSEEKLEFLSMNQLISLTEEDKRRLLELKNATHFSRLKLLAPIKKKLTEQASLGQPLQLVSVDGEVKIPATYPLAQDATVLDLVKAAGGLTESSFTAKAELIRTVLDENGSADVLRIDVDLNALLLGQSEPLKLRSRDRLNILRVPEWQEDLQVEVVGEVRFPGIYSIKRGETLSQLVERVGGLTGYGDAEAAIFTREELKDREKENLQRLAEELRKQIASESLRRSTGTGEMVSYSEAKQLLVDLTKVEAVGRLVIDLPGLIANNSRSQDIILKDGDVLYIPSKSQSINVLGEVYVPSSHLYDDTLGFEEYITQSGGYREMADQERTYIIRANGSVVVPGNQSGSWFASANHSSFVRPGDTIVVPFDSGYMDNLTLWTNATQILYQLGIAAAAIGRL